MKILLFIISLLMVVDNALALSIIKPQKGDTYFVGQTLTVELQPLTEEDVEQIIISTNHFSGTAINDAPFRYDVKLNEPVNGQETIGIVGVFKNGKTILLTTYIYVKLPDDIEVKDVMLEKDLMIVYMMPSDVDQDSIRAEGIFSDGSQYSLSTYSKVRYESLDESIAKVDPNGVVTGTFPGKTSIKVIAGNITKEMKVKVIYKLDSIKGITVTALDKSNDIKWEKSPYEGGIVSDYKVYRSDNKYGFDKEIIGTVAPGTYTFIDTKPVAGVQYYSVEAFSQKYNAGSDMESWVAPVPVPQTSN